MPTSHYAFRALPFPEQIVLVWEEGTYLATRYEEEDTIGLYHMGSFFVELYYDHLASTMTERIRTFTSTTCIEDYVAYISLQELKLQ